MAHIEADLISASPTELLGLYSRILDELVDRRIVWSRNAPAGDYAELLVAEAFGGRIARSSKKSWDVRVDDRLLQVKCRVVGPGKKSASYSPFRSFSFHSCIFVVLDASSYEVVHATEVDRDVVERSSALSKWVAGSRVTVSQVLSFAGTRDVTTELRRAQADVDARGRLAQDD